MTSPAHMASQMTHPGHMTNPAYMASQMTHPGHMTSPAHMASQMTRPGHMTNPAYMMSQMTHPEHHYNMPSPAHTSSSTETNNKSNQLQRCHMTLNDKCVFVLFK